MIIKNQYIIAGERRWRACQLAKTHESSYFKDDIEDEKILNCL